MVFILLNANSEDYHRLHSYISDNDKILDESHPAFAAILQYIEDKVNRVSVDLQKDLEVVAQLVEEYMNINRKISRKLISISVKQEGPAKS